MNTIVCKVWVRAGASCALLALWAASGTAQQAVQDRIDADTAAGRPVVVHVVVALCDNLNQGIVPVPAAIGNGQDPSSNLYWGALYGVRTYLSGKGGWKKFAVEKPENDAVLERAAFHAAIQRGDSKVPVYIVADAWDGAKIREALQAFLEMAAGRRTEQVMLPGEAKGPALSAGGAAHLVAFVGHNGLMDFSLEPPSPPAVAAAARGAIILACASKPYFVEHLDSAKAKPVLLTTGLMAPEAYTLDAAIRRWASGATQEEVREGAAKAYDTYQHCGLKGARRLFWNGP